MGPLETADLIGLIHPYSIEVLYESYTTANTAPARARKWWMPACTGQSGKGFYDYGVSL